MNFTLGNSNFGMLRESANGQQAPLPNGQATVRPTFASLPPSNPAVTAPKSATPPVFTRPTFQVTTSPIKDVAQPQPPHQAADEEEEDELASDPEVNPLATPAPVLQVPQGDRSISNGSPGPSSSHLVATLGSEDVNRKTRRSLTPTTTKVGWLTISGCVRD